MLSGVAVSDYLVIRNDDIGRDTLVLQCHSFFDGAEIVAKMQTTRRTIPC